MRCPTRRCRFASSAGSCFNPGRRTRIDVNDRDMSERTAVLFDLRDIVSAVLQIIAIGDRGGCHGGERNGHLTIMHGCGGEHATDRDLTIRGINVQL